MKSIFTLILTFLLILSITGCKPPTIDIEEVDIPLPQLPEELLNIAYSHSLEPIQKGSRSPNFKLQDAIFKPKAEFHVQCRLLSKKYYSNDRNSKLSPVDLAIGWNWLDNEDILNLIDISQSGRWWRWTIKDTRDLPVSVNKLNSYGSNVHIIPSNQYLYDLIKKSKPGDHIQLGGYLVHISFKDGSYWNSSLSRTDRGNGACELLYLTHFQINPKSNL